MASSVSGKSCGWLEAARTAPLLLDAVIRKLHRSDRYPLSLVIGSPAGSQERSYGRGFTQDGMLW